MLIDREHGRGLGISLYETEEDMQRGNEALNQMSPPAQGGRRTDVALYEIALHKQRWHADFCFARKAEASCLRVNTSPGTSASHEKQKSCCASLDAWT